MAFDELLDYGVPFIVKISNICIWKYIQSTFFEFKNDTFSYLKQTYFSYLKTVRFSHLKMVHFLYLKTAKFSYLKAIRFFQPFRVHKGQWHILNCLFKNCVWILLLLKRIVKVYLEKCFCVSFIEIRWRWSTLY